MNDIERLEIERDEALVARDFANEHDDRVTKERDELRTELERVRKQAAALREALVWLHAGSICCDPASSKASRDSCVICNILKEDVGSDYIHRDQVKPLVEMAQLIEKWCDGKELTDFEMTTVDNCVSHAKTLGL